MKLRTYEFEYDKIDIIGVKSFDNLIINTKYVTHMHPFGTKEKKYKGKYYWMFHEHLMGCIIDKKTYDKIKKRLE